MARVLVPLAEGCEDLEAVTLVDILRRAGAEVLTASLAEGPVRGSRGTLFTADSSLAAALGARFDLVALPGGQPGTENLRRDARLLDLLRRHAAQGGLCAAVCAAPAVLEEAGLLKGRRATAYPGSLRAEAGGTILEEAPVVVDGPIITGRSAGAAMDFALALVQQLLGPEKRRSVEAGLLRPAQG